MEWLSNIIHMVKKNGKLKVCMEFRNLNLATLKDKYQIPITNILIDRAIKHQYLSFIDGYSGYNQILIAKEDVAKIIFRCSNAIKTYELPMMPFSLRNASTTYQWVMNVIFHDFIDRFMKIYIDDIVVNSEDDEKYLVDLHQSFFKM